MEGEEEEEEGDREEEGTDPDMYPSDTALSGVACCTTTVGTPAADEAPAAAAAAASAVVPVSASAGDDSQALALFSGRLIADEALAMLLPPDGDGSPLLVLQLRCAMRAACCCSRDGC